MSRRAWLLVAVLVLVGAPGWSAALQEPAQVDVWSMLGDLSPLYAPAIVLGLLARRVLVFGWYHAEAIAAAQERFTRQEQRHKDELERSRQDTERERLARERWEKTSWQWATTGKRALQIAAGEREGAS